MRVVPTFVVSVLVAALAIAGTSSPVPAGSDSSLEGFLPAFEEATTRFVNGDAALWKRHASHRDDVTIMGAWGGYEKGWNEVGKRYDWAAARIQESGAKVAVEYLSAAASGDFAYTVSIERSAVRRANQDKAEPVALRVTRIFRKEDGAWKLVHRQADPLVRTRDPSSASLDADVSHQ